MKKVVLSITTLLGFSIFVDAQQLINKETLQVNDTIVLNVGNDLLINKPQSFDFVNISEVKKKFGFSNISSLASAGLSAGAAVVGVGAATHSVGAVVAGAKVAQMSGTAADVAWTKEAIDGLNASDQAKSIVGKKMRILKFKKEGNEKRGEHFYAIVAGEGKHDYKIEVESAFTSGEIFILEK